MSFDPLHQFVVKEIVPLSFYGYNISFTNSALFMGLALVAPCILLFFSLRGQKMIPGRLQCFSEMIYEFLFRILEETNHQRGQAFFSLIFSLFLFVAFGNLLGMLPYAFTFSSQIIVTFSLAFTIFVAITILGILKQGFQFFRIFFPKNTPLILAPLLVPIEIISYLSRPVSLSVRLFANMMAGHVMIKVFSGFCVAMGMWGVVPLVLNIILTFFECLVALLQAYVFTVLTCLYLNDALHGH